MTIQQAEQFIRAYLQVLSDDTKRGSRRDPSLLPAPKERVMKAIKLEMARAARDLGHPNAAEAVCRATVERLART